MRFFVLMFLFSVHSFASTVNTPLIEAKINGHKDLAWNAKVQKIAMRWECYNKASPSDVLLSKSVKTKVKDGTFRFPAYQWNCENGDSHRFNFGYQISGAAQIVFVGISSALKYGTDEAKYRPIDQMTVDMGHITFYALPNSAMELRLASGNVREDFEAKLCNKENSCTKFVIETQPNLIDEAGRIFAGEQMDVAWGTSTGRFPEPMMNGYFFIAPGNEKMRVEHRVTVFANLTDKSHKDISEKKSIVEVQSRFDLPASNWPTATRNLIIPDEKIPLP
jgi:hypothetical protein